MKMGKYLATYLPSHTVTISTHTHFVYVCLLLKHMRLLNQSSARKTAVCIVVIRQSR